MSSWVKYHFAHLRRWREYAEAVAKAAKDLRPDAEVYVVGSVAEGRATVLSDIDILVVLEKAGNEDRKYLPADIVDRAVEKYSLPVDAPVEIHVASREELARWAGKAMIKVG
ncbi:nucleotidyltransferase domain-containing protein [Thermofilum pendens]|uniref:DNA polymerase, beta domain protein region n=1 Tax=Thermofilum pendens (strain DSM 2475 / Hrk 5) TaxID=368408 RepID=A1RYW1_THEPD|nr:nucleotidyltransferase domain-containing protein [Thermofilum pendens]ABL78391.1 DNA polymerase, beta domain protein region [Thermofilum pendens Hrk 5]